jgi:hypothetical protein
VQLLLVQLLLVLVVQLQELLISGREYCTQPRQ